MKAYLIGFGLAVLLGCLVGMHATGRGLLVESTYIANHWRAPQGVLSCRYIVGFEILVDELRYDPKGFRGSTKCPGMREFSDNERERLRAQRELRQRERRSSSLFR